MWVIHREKQPEFSKQQSTLFHILAVKANCWKVKGRCQKKENVKIERKKREREIKCQSFGD